MTCRYNEYSTTTEARNIFWYRFASDGPHDILTYQGIQNTVTYNSAAAGLSTKFQHTAQSSYESFHTIKLINATKEDEGEYSSLFVGETSALAPWKPLNVSCEY